MTTTIQIPTRTVTDHNKLVSEATQNIQHFRYPNKFSPDGVMFLKGCRKCNKLVDYNHSREPRFMAEGRWVYVCECKECQTPMLLDSVDFWLLRDKV